MTDPFSLLHSNENKKNAFSNGGNNEHGLKKRYAVNRLIILITCNVGFRDKV